MHEIILRIFSRFLLNFFFAFFCFHWNFIRKKAPQFLKNHLLNSLIEIPDKLSFQLKRIYSKTQQSENIIKNSLQSYERKMIKKARQFIDKLKKPSLKYNDDEMMDFLIEFDEMSKHEKYTCLEIILSRAKKQIEDRKYGMAQENLILAIPLCDEQKFQFKEFDLETMLRKSWVDKYNRQKDRQQYAELLRETGFVVPEQKLKKPKKSNICDCCTGCII